MPVVFNSFLQDHGNPLVDDLLSRYEIAQLEKAPGGILIHVRSSDAERKLVGQEVHLMGRSFKIKQQSPLSNKFFLDIFGVRSTEVANNLFMGLSAIGARPLFLTPRDVSMETHVSTSTWRFYFGQEEPPTCLKIHGFVTNQLDYGRKFYLSRGKRSDAPPERAVDFKKSLYAVTLPTGAEPLNNAYTPMMSAGTSNDHLSLVPSDKGPEFNHGHVAPLPPKTTESVEQGQRNQPPNKATTWSNAASRYPKFQQPSANGESQQQDLNQTDVNIDQSDFDM
ncbi:hypothetical protein PHMEG_00012385 [Phytophthora megakarya]|uniref:Uncharacterized protein n=1 Tax=Phytophthora megakarya TaxID=4795 RepID=A0A225W9B1_9STRA|nr:hypothetical protein PHMEG_00012385 [Phytophthora megakarya]